MKVQNREQAKLVLAKVRKLPRKQKWPTVVALVEALCDEIEMLESDLEPTPHPKPLERQ